MVNSYSVHYWMGVSEYSCDECGESVSSMEALMMHYKKEHPAQSKRFLKNVSC